MASGETCFDHQTTRWFKMPAGSSKCDSVPEGVRAIFNESILVGTPLTLVGTGAACLAARFSTIATYRCFRNSVRSGTGDADSESQLYLLDSTICSCTGKDSRVKLVLRPCREIFPVSFVSYMLETFPAPRLVVWLHFHQWFFFAQKLSRLDAVLLGTAGIGSAGLRRYGIE